MAATLLVGCGQSFYPTDNHNLVATNVNISEANFRVVGLVEGQAKATYILGIGGLSGKALRSNAYSDMVRNAKLKGSQMIVNATIHQMHYGFLPFRWTKTVKYQGTVIEFVNPAQPTASVADSAPVVSRSDSPAKTSKVAPTPKKKVDHATKRDAEPKAKKREVKPAKIEVEKPQIAVDSELNESKKKEIDSMSKFRRENYLTDLSNRINRLCSKPKQIAENSEKIEAMLAEMRYILENYECRQSYQNSYNKFVEKLSK